MNTKPLGVAVAGLGIGAKVHLPALRACALTEPVALWHPRVERISAVALVEELPGYSEFEALLNDPKVEAVVIATPPAVRQELAEMALRAGKHLLLEKPVALRTEQAEALQRQALELGLCCAVNFEYRAVPAFQQLAQLLHGGWLGDPWLLRFDWLMGSRSDPQRPWNWYASAAEGGGVLGALGSHTFDMMEWLVGPLRQVQAQLAVAIGDRPLADGSGRALVDAADTALLQVQLEPIWAPQQPLLPAQIALSSVARCGRGCWLELHGSEGSLVLGSANQSDYVHGFGLQGARSGEPLVAIPPDPKLSFSRTWEDGRVAPVVRLLGWWAEAVQQGRPMLPGLLEGVASQRAMDASMRSNIEQLTIGLAAGPATVGT
jgi:predicted dehydrogenase